MPEVLVLEGARTPFCSWAGGARADGQKGGALKPLDPFDLAAASLRAALERSGLAPHAVERVAFGNAYHVGPHACYGAKYVALRAGLSHTVPGVAVVMACASGLQAVISAKEDIERGAAVAAATGADNCSAIPRNVFVPSFKDASCQRHIAETAQAMARDCGFTREDQDRYAMESHRKAAAARARGVFSEEIVPVKAPVKAEAAVPVSSGAVAGGTPAMAPAADNSAAGTIAMENEIAIDDAILEQPDPQKFAESKLMFDDGSQATPANTHAVVDGGSAVILASPDGAKKARNAPLGRIVGSCVIGVEPERMAFATVSATRVLIQKVGWTLDSVDLFEINETFAAQMLVATKELGLPAEKVNPNGGGIAIGHPFGGTGPRLVHTLLKELRRRGARRGVAAICAGGGSGVAVALETL